MEETETRIGVADISTLSREEMIAAIRQGFADIVLGAAGRLSPIYLASMVLICVALYLARRPGKGFWAWMMPKEVYFHPSHKLDLKLFLVGFAISATGAFNLVALSAFIATSIQKLFSSGADTSATWPPVLIAAMLILAADFAGYWVHRIHHEWRRVWPFHAVHHSAEVMTPVTLYRIHPLYEYVASVVNGVVVGLVQGVLLGLFVGGVEFTTIVGVNLFLYVFNIAGSNLRHSHIWLSFGQVLEHVFISPAQHQVHHSIDPKHHNKNYGQIFAIWDWMFGSLYVPKTREELAFGLADRHGNRIEQPHKTLHAALFEPFVSAFRKPPRL